MNSGGNTHRFFCINRFVYEERHLSFLFVPRHALSNIASTGAPVLYYNVGCSSLRNECSEHRSIANR